MTESSDPIYLDNNATTQPYPEVIAAMQDAFLASYANPGSRHAAGRHARRALEAARETMAEILGANPEELIFTSGGTESINMALFGLTAGRKPGVIALTAGEHPAALESCRRLERDGWELHFLDVEASGKLREDQYGSLDWDRLALVSVILAHNETGVLQDLKPLASACREHGVELHVDAVQAVGKVPVDFHALAATALSLGAHKFHGPRGVGALLLKKDAQCAPYLYGGHQESGHRPGTEPVALVVGMAEALRIWNANRDERIRTLAELRGRLERGLAETCAPVVVNGSGAPRLPNTLNISFPGVDGEALLVALDLEGIACSLGSTCASGSAEPAPVLVAMGCSPEVMHSAVRFSLSWGQTAEDIDEAIRRIVKVVTHLRGPC
jgi:cysteine desulfurase